MDTLDDAPVTHIEPVAAEVPYDEFNLALRIMLNTDWVTLFKTVGLDEAARQRSMTDEVLVPIDEDANPMPEGAVMDQPSATEYLQVVHNGYLNCGNLDLIVVDTEAFAESCTDGDDNASCVTGPFEVPSSESIIQLRK